MATQFSGGTIVNTTFTGAVRSDLQSYLKTHLTTAGWSCVAASAGWGPGGVHTFTVTIASPGVVTDTGHGWLGGERVILQTTGALPTGLSVNTVYFIKYIDANTYNLSTTSGGSNINTSGSQSGSHTINTESILMQSATQTNVTNPIRVRLKDNRGNCIQVSIENQAGTVVGQNDTGNGGSLLPASSKTFQVIATRYHFLCFKQGGELVREFVMAGMLYVPSLLTGVTDHGYMFCDSSNDGDSSGIRPSFRSSVNINQQNGANRYQFLWNSSISDAYVQSNIGAPQAVISYSLGYGPGITRWANDDLNTSDILIASGLVYGTDEPKIKGQLFDMVYIASAFAVDATDTFNSHTWQNITNNNTGSPSGGIWVATS